MPKISVIKRDCKVHGFTDFYVQKRSKRNGFKIYCKKCQSEYIKNKRRERKIALVKEFGGKCFYCEYSKCLAALHFHHLDPKTKDKGLCRMGSGSLEKLREECKKCVLVCANCHAELEYT